MTCACNNHKSICLDCAEECYAILYGIFPLGRENDPQISEHYKGYCGDHYEWWQKKYHDELKTAREIK